MAEIKLPDKRYFSIGEVKQFTGLECHVLRYWEEQFGVLKPKKGRNGRRSYRTKEIELILKIKELLYDKKYTIKGAKAALRHKDKKEITTEKKPVKTPPPDDNREFIVKVHHELKMLQKTLQGSKSDDLFGD